MKWARLKQKGTVPFTVVLLTIFFFSITSILFSVGFQYPLRTSTPLPQSEYDTGFWNLTDAISDPLNISDVSNSTRDTIVSGEAIPIIEWYFSYLSENEGPEDVRINSVVLRRANSSEASPTILFLHGYGERYSDYIEILRDFAAHGFVVMGIDHPGCGGSTGLPPLSPLTFLNVSDGPQSSNLYHSVWASARAVTLLESLPYVDSNAIVVSGDSMGAMTTFIEAAIDSRVDAVVPMIAAGNMHNSIESGSLLNSVIVPSYSIRSEEMANMIRWFDPIAYARGLTQPTLMLFGTNDDFFPLVSMMDTVDAISAPLTLCTIPNWGHGVYEPWAKTMTHWMRSEFLNSSMMSCELDVGGKITPFGSAISVKANSTGAARAIICWRSGEPGAPWLQTEMMLVEEGESSFYAFDILPAIIGKVSFFVIVDDGNSVAVASSIQIGTAGSFLMPLLLIMSTTGLMAIIYRGEWAPRPDELVREAPYALGIFLLMLGFFLPFVIIRGRAYLTVLDIIELFGTTLLLAGWFLPTFALSICFILALSAYRHRFQFKVAGTLWTPVVVVLAILFIILSAVFGYFGSLILVEFGAGGPVFLAGMVLMQVLDKTVRDRFERRFKAVRDRVVSLGDQIQERVEAELGLNRSDKQEDMK